MQRRNLGKCKVDSCKNSAKAREVCTKHYMRMHYYGSFEKPKTVHPVDKLAHACTADPTFKSRKKLDERIYVCFLNIQSRCLWKGDKKYQCYGAKGIRNLLTMEELIYLWVRDGAARMNQPSIDRLHNDKDYTLENCRFIEMHENRMRRFS